MNYFGPLKTVPRSLISCGCEIFKVLKYPLSIFLHFTHPCHMILSKKKSCLLLNGVSTENQKRASVLQIRREFSRQRNMTRIHVGLDSESVESEKMQNENVLLTLNSTRTHRPEIWSMVLNQLSLSAVLLKRPLYIHVLPTEVYIVQIAKRHISPLFAFNLKKTMKHWHLHVESDW